MWYSILTRMRGRRGNIGFYSPLLLPPEWVVIVKVAEATVFFCPPPLDLLGEFGRTLDFEPVLSAEGSLDSFGDGTSGGGDEFGPSVGDHGWPF